MADSNDIVIQQGKTFSLAVRWETEPVVYKAITGAQKTAPVRLTVAAHGVPDGWRVAVTSVKGMTQLNAANTPPRVRDYVAATVVDADTLDLNSINAAEYSTYLSGGYLQYYTPVDLSSYTARMTIKDRVGGTELLSLTTVNGGIVLDTVKRIITLKITAAATAALTWRRGVYDLEMVAADGTVTGLTKGKVTVELEVTT